MPTIKSDPRIDPRIKAVLGDLPSEPLSDVASRDALIAEVSTPEVVAGEEMMTAMLDLLDSEDIAPSTGLDISTREVESSPTSHALPDAPA